MPTYIHTKDILNKCIVATQESLQDANKRAGEWAVFWRLVGQLGRVHQVILEHGFHVG